MTFMRACLAAAVSILPTCSLATVDYGAVNHVTRQCTLLDDGMLFRPIGWRGVGEVDDVRRYCQGLGYAYTGFPYAIESIVAASVILMIGRIGLVAYKKKRAS